MHSIGRRKYDIVTAQFKKRTGKNIYRRFCSGDLIPKSKQWFDYGSRKISGHLFSVTIQFYSPLHLLQPLQSWAVKSQQRCFGCIKARGDFLQVSQS